MLMILIFIKDSAHSLLSTASRQLAISWESVSLMFGISVQVRKSRENHSATLFEHSVHTLTLCKAIHFVGAPNRPSIRIMVLYTHTSYHLAIYNSVMRHFQETHAEEAAYVVNCSGRPIPILNAGSGKDQHPTQALLDMYTLRRSFEKTGGMEGKVILMAGDLNRGRTVRSLAKLLCLFPGIKLIFSAPPGFGMRDDVIQYLKRYKMNFVVSEEFVTHLPEADAVYMTRIQDEHDSKDGTTSKKSYDEFSLKYEHLEFLKPECAIMHPLPRRDELDPKIDNDPRAKYWRQERNGMWTRAALLAMTGGV